MNSNKFICTIIVFFLLLLSHFVFETLRFLLQLLFLWHKKLILNRFMRALFIIFSIICLAKKIERTKEE